MAIYHPVETLKVMPTSSKQTVISMYGMVQHGTMWAISLVLLDRRVLRDPWEPLVHKGHKAILAQWEPLGPKAFKACKVPLVIQDPQVPQALLEQLGLLEQLDRKACRAYKDHKVILDHKVSKACKVRQDRKERKALLVILVPQEQLDHREPLDPLEQMVLTVPLDRKDHKATLDPQEPQVPLAHLVAASLRI